MSLMKGEEMETDHVIKTFVFDFFEKLGPIPGETEEEKRYCDFIAVGLIDSFGIFNLIVEVENQLKVTFDSEDLEDPRFKTIGGLIEIISQKRKGRGEE